MAPHWYLGFDPATKTFGFVIIMIDKEGLRENYKTIIQNLKDSKNIRECQREIKKYFNVLDGDTLDLCPNVKDTNISLVERVSACSKVLKERILPHIQGLRKDQVTTVIESQMNQNDKSRIIPSVIVSHLYNLSDIAIVGASLKNTVNLYDEHKPSVYSTKVSWKTAIKHHTRYTLISLVNDFDFDALRSKSKAEMGHIGDSFMQILGYIQNPVSKIKG